jgi:hypothetical protein
MRYANVEVDTSNAPRLERPNQERLRDHIPRPCRGNLWLTTSTVVDDEQIPGCSVRHHQKDVVQLRIESVVSVNKDQIARRVELVRGERAV